MGVLYRGKIQMLAPDEGPQHRKELITRRKIARRRACLDIGGTLPCAAQTFVIPFCRFHRDAHGRHTGIGPQPQVCAKDIALAREIIERPAHRAGGADKGGAGVVKIAGVKARFVEQADQIDIGRIIQLARAHLTHRQHDHACAAVGVLFRHAGQLATFDLRFQPCGQRGLRCGVGEIGQRAGHLLQRPSPCQISQPRHQRHAPLALP